MKAKKDNLFYVDATNLVRGVHFEVVTDTPFNSDMVNHFYNLEDHVLDYELLELLGLGVVQNLHFKEDYFIYNASSDQVDNTFGVQNEILRVGIYYQITHPNYDDKDLEVLIFETKGGTAYLRLLQTYNTDKIINRLKEIFDSKKGNVAYLNS